MLKKKMLPYIKEFLAYNQSYYREHPCIQPQQESLLE